jgi:hypothetical protein
MSNNFPKIHNAAWPGVVGKGPESEESFIGLDEMIEHTVNAEVNGVKFDGLDLFLSLPHVDIESSDDDIKALADKLQSKGLVAGTVCAPIWPPTGGGSAMGDETERVKFLDMTRKSCAIAQKLKQLGARPHGTVRIDSAVDPGTWAKDPNGSKKIAETFRLACDIAEDYGERLVIEGEICWGGMHSWKANVELLERTARPETLGFQADMAHTFLFLFGHNAKEDALLPANFNCSNRDALGEAFKTMTDALRPWTYDFHVAQNDGTVKGMGSHDKTGRHCLPKDPNGKLDVPWVAGFWLRDGNGHVLKKCRHICWDGCMFPNSIMSSQDTWNEILAALISVRDAHGWSE